MCRYGSIAIKGSRSGVLLCAAVAGLALAAVAAHADSPTRDVPVLLLADDSGLLGAISRWIDESTAAVDSHIKGARRSIDDLTGRAGEVAKDAAGAVADLPKPTIVAGRQRCDMAPNGAADCSGAIIALCRAKGYSTGQSLDIEATRKCPAEALLSGRMAPRECPSESTVTRALCR